MNPSDRHGDDVLLFVLGELDDARQAAVHSAMAEDAELAATAQGLAAAVAAVRAENAGRVGDDFNDRLRRRLLEDLDNPQANPPRPQLRTRSLKTWRWIMRSRLSRTAAAVIFLLAVAGVAFWFHSGGATPALADFLEPILNAKTVKFKITSQWTSLPAGMAETTGISAEMQKSLLKPSTAEVLMLDSNRSRTEWNMLGQSKAIQIWDGGQGKGLWLHPAEKRATVTAITNMPKQKSPGGGDPLAYYRSLLLNARDKPDVKRESLGETVTDGRRVVGFRITSPEQELRLWGDPKTGLPTRIEATVAIMPQIKITMSDFAFNVPVDESLFSLEPPAGYKIDVEDYASDDSPSKEKELIDMFREFGKWSGGRFPDLLDTAWMRQQVSQAEWCQANLARPAKTDAKRHQDLTDANTRIDRGMKFVVLLPKEADRHYAGRGVSIGAGSAPVFWYRPKDAKQYRVVRADLSVHEADAPPTVPEVNLEKDLIAMFRQYAALSDGSFPDKLDVGATTAILCAPTNSSGSQDRSQPRSPKEEQQVQAALATLLRGLTFSGLLPKEADAHYAGRRAKLGAADRPVFWYRPQKSTTYRVIYADLSVREAPSPPRVPVELPEQELLDSLREYSRLSGAFPDAMDDSALTAMAQMLATKNSRLVFLDLAPTKGKQIDELMQKLRALPTAAAGKATPEQKKMSADLNQEFFKLVDWEKLAPGKTLDDKQKTKLLDANAQKLLNSQMPKIIAESSRYTTGLLFPRTLPPEADAHYAGKGVKPGAADKPIFWYRPADAKTYRVTYADLSVREVPSAPRVPEAKPVPALSGGKK